MPKIKIKIDKELNERLNSVTDAGGYSSVEEFVVATCKNLIF